VAETAGHERHDLRTHTPGFTLVRECLRIQSDARPLGPLARVLGFSPLHPDASSWYRGALGELAVAAALAELGPEWEVLHAVPVGSGAAIDHLAIGPSGVFTLNARNGSAARVWLAGMTMHPDGPRQHHVRNSLQESARAARMLGAAAGERVEVRPVIVVANPRAVVRSDDTRVAITSATQLTRWLNRQPHVLSDEQLENLSMLAEQPGTWGAGARSSGDATSHLEQFDELRIRVDAARSRRRRLLAAGILTSAIALVALALQVLASI
jgi:hypothetical protein